MNLQEDHDGGYLSCVDHMAPGDVKVRQSASFDVSSQCEACVVCVSVCGSAVEYSNYGLGSPEPYTSRTEFR